MLLQLTVLLLPLLACGNSHAVGKISLKLQVVRMDHTVQYVRRTHYLSSKEKTDDEVNTFIMVKSL